MPMFRFGNWLRSSISALSISPGLFRKEVGLPPHAYLENVRVKRARELLLRGVPITDVSAAVGYADQSHLTNRFKRLLGMTPGQVARNREMAGR